MTFLKPILSLLLVGLLSPSARAQDHVAMLLHEHTYRALQAHVDLYAQDVEDRFRVKVQVIKGKWETPKEVRETIRSLHRDKAISGVLLVGAMPMHRFFMHENANPNPLYYEDFDLEFVDNNKDGVDDAYKGKANLKVWVANIRATEKARDDALPELRHFFAKTHDYYIGKTVPERRTLLFSAEIPPSDGDGTGDWFKRRGGARFSAPEDVTILEGKSCTHKAALEAFKKHSYSLTCIALHSDETGHALYDDDLMAQEIADFKTGSLITISHGCFAANWTKTEHDNNGPNCGLSWVFSKHLGQALVGQVRSGGVGFDNLIYERLRAGDYLGKAYLNEPLSALYDLPEVSGYELRKVSLSPESWRGGFLVINHPVTIESLGKLISEFEQQAAIEATKDTGKTQMEGYSLETLAFPVAETAVTLMHGHLFDERGKLVPFASSTRDILESIGIIAPAGSAAWLDCKTKTLWLRNRPEVLAGMKKQLASLATIEPHATRRRTEKDSAKTR